MWFTEFGSGNIGVMSLASSQITEYSIPTANSMPYIIVNGPDGNLWFNEANGDKIGKIDPKTTAITEYPVSSGAYPVDIVTGSDGNLWITNIQATR